MMDYAPETRFERWQEPGLPAIEYPRAVLEELIAEATDGLYLLSHGGVEVGGVLFGERTPAGARVLSARPLKLEYAFGPSFLLSANDYASLEALLRSRHLDAALRGLIPVGWYVSHPRTGLRLTPTDLNIFEKYFPHPHDFALVLHPQRLRPTHVAFFLRDAARVLRPDQPLGEFTVDLTRFRVLADERDRTQRLAAASASPSPAPNPAGTASPASVPAAEIAEVEFVDTPPSAPPTPLELVPLPSYGSDSRVRIVLRGNIAWRAAATVVLLAALLIAGAMGLWWYKQQDTSLALHVLDNEGQLRIEWNRAALPILRAASGTLTIREGGQETRLAFTPQQLRTGSVTYSRRHASVDVRLEVTVPGEPPYLEMARFVGAAPPAEDRPESLLAASRIPSSGAQPGEPAPVDASAPIPASGGTPSPPPTTQSAPASPSSPPPSAAAKPGPAPAPQLLAPAKPSPDPPASSLAAPPPAAAKTSAPVAAGPGAQPPRFIPSPASDAPAARAADPSAPLLAQIPPPPVASPSPSSPPPAIPINPPRQSVPQPPPSPPAATAPASPAAETAASAPQSAYRGPRRGRFIWTGQLARNQVLRIENGKPSAGFVTGVLPNAPVRLAAYPAELSSGGLVVYTANPSDQNRNAEPPSAANGWNRTVYRFDPRRANSVVVVEPPSAANNWSRLEVRAQNENRSVIIFEWAVAEP